MYFISRAGLRLDFSVECLTSYLSNPVLCLSYRLFNFLHFRLLLRLSSASLGFALLVARNTNLFLRFSVSSRHGERQGWKEDVQVAWKRHRPPRGMLCS